MASQRQVGEVIGAAVLPRNDVFNVKCMETVMLLQQTAVSQRLAARWRTMFPRSGDINRGDAASSTSELWLGEWR
jgi:hypothetical protein